MLQISAKKIGIRERVKTLRDITDPSVRGRPLEAHHWIEPYRETHTDTKEGLFAETLPEHGISHYIEARMSPTTDLFRANSWAVGMIIRRMNKEDYLEFVEMKKVVDRRRGW